MDSEISKFIVSFGGDYAKAEEELKPLEKALAEKEEALLAGDTFWNRRKDAPKTTVAEGAALACTAGAAYKYCRFWNWPYVRCQQWMANRKAAQDAKDKKEIVGAAAGVKFEDSGEALNELTLVAKACDAAGSDADLKKAADESYAKFATAAVRVQANAQAQAAEKASEVDKLKAARDAAEKKSKADGATAKDTEAFNKANALHEAAEKDLKGINEQFSKFSWLRRQRINLCEKACLRGSSDKAQVAFAVTAALGLVSSAVVSAFYSSVYPFCAQNVGSFGSALALCAIGKGNSLLTVVCVKEDVDPDGQREDKDSEEEVVTVEKEVPASILAKEPLAIALAALEVGVVGCAASTIWNKLAQRKTETTPSK